MELVYIGTIVNPRGYKGEMKLDDVMENCPRVPEDTEVYVGYSPNFSQRYYVETWKNSKNLSYVKLKNIDSDELVKEFKEKGIFIDEEILDSLYEDEEEVIRGTGLQVFLENGDYFGEVLEEWDLPSNKIWYVQIENGKLPLPITDETLIEYNKEKDTAIVKLLDGIMDLVELDDE